MNLSTLDRPEILSVIFHPRPELGAAPVANHIQNHLIQVDKQVDIGARFYTASPASANILFFHGNGEIVADYDQLGPVFNNLGINLLAVDYRGYGRSNGNPSIRAMMSDCHIIFDYVSRWMMKNEYTGPLIVMGRSLGSACALELAAERGDQINGLIIESGFAFAAPLLRLLGVDIDGIGFKETEGFANLDKIVKYLGPTLIIHAEYDHIIPFSDGMALFKASKAQDKGLLKIPNANHNDIFMHALDDYLHAVQKFVDRLRK